MEFDRDGRRSRVTVRREGSGWCAEVDGRQIRLDARLVGGRLSLLLDPGGPDPSHNQEGRPGDIRACISHELLVEERAPGELVVHVDGRQVPLSVAQARSRGDAARPAAGSEPGGPQQVAAPMPGRIVKVLVRAGDRVTARQPVVVIEAMKMENELRAARDGTVAEVLVAEGALVEARTVLVALR